MKGKKKKNHELSEVSNKIFLTRVRKVKTRDAIQAMRRRRRKERYRLHRLTAPVGSSRRSFDLGHLILQVASACCELGRCTTKVPL